MVHDTARAEAFHALVRERRSIRAFLPTAIPQPIIEHVFNTAQQAPSNCNAQPWIVHVVSGKTIERLRVALVAAARAGEPQPDVPRTDHYVEQYRERRIGAAKALFQATGVGRDDLAAREASFLRNFAMFDAPHAALVFMPSYFGLREAADCGMYLQNLMLALTAHGLGSCAQGALSHYMPALREVLEIEPGLICLFGLSFGYPDYNHPSDAARTVRAPLPDTTRFHD